MFECGAGDDLRPGVLVEVAAQFGLEGGDAVVARFVRLHDAQGVQHDHMADQASACLQFLGDLEGEVAAE